MRKVYVAGGAHTPFIGKFHPNFIWKGHPDFGKKENPDLDQYLTQVTQDALAQCTTSATQIDKAYVGNFVGELFSCQGHLGALLAAADPSLAGKPIARLEGACASGGLAFACGVDAIRAGSDIVLVAGVEIQTTQNAKIGADYLARASHYKTQREIDEFTFPALFARRAKAVVGETETTLEDCARASVKAYANANKNRFAHMNAVKMSLEEANTASDKNPLFLKNPELKEYMRVSDCSQVSDGASALILCSEEGLKKIGKHPSQTVCVLACEVATASLTETPAPLKLSTVEMASARAYRNANIKAEQVQIAEVHDCFTITEILMYEALGFAKQGQGARLLREGKTNLDGTIPVNTGGGLVGFGHPVGATGVKQVLELYRQCFGLCDGYQIKKTPALGLAANMGGDDRTAVVTIVERVS